MATRAQKRKAAEAPDIQEASMKKQFLEIPLVTAPPNEEDGNQEGDDKSYPSNNERSSEERNESDTPLTPLSPAAAATPPGRKRFPSEYKKIKCTYPGCDKSFNRPIRLEYHIRTHEDNRACKCTYPGCDKAYYDDKHLQQHIKGSHIGERKYVCSYEGCGKGFLTGTRLRRHEDSHKGHERWKCTGYPGCDQTFRKHQTLERHIRSDHLELAPFPCPHVDPVTGVPCDAGYDGPVGLRKHMEREHTAPRFSCPSCIVPNSFNSDGTPKNLGFSSKLQLENHNKREHAHCAFCDMEFSSHRELISHMESQHSGKSIEERRIYGCTYSDCDKAFTTSSNLAAHFRAAHDGQRFICGNFDVSYHPGLSIFDPADACGKDFLSKANLEDHIRTSHLGLASVINANRASMLDTLSSEFEVSLEGSIESSPDVDMGAGCDTGLNNDYNSDTDEYFPEKKNQRNTRRNRKHIPTVIDELVGRSQLSDPRRNIPCPVIGCNHMFMRKYDVDKHLKAAHGPRPENLPPGIATGFGPDGPPPAPSARVTRGWARKQRKARGHSSAGSEADQQSLGDGNFWIGADDNDGTPARTPGSEIWLREQDEMRRLIDEEHIDPALVGL